MSKLRFIFPGIRNSCKSQARSTVLSLHMFIAVNITHCILVNFPCLKQETVQQWWTRVGAGAPTNYHSRCGRHCWKTKVGSVSKFKCRRRIVNHVFAGISIVRMSEYFLDLKQARLFMKVIYSRGSPCVLWVFMCWIQFCLHMYAFRDKFKIL